MKELFFDRSGKQVIKPDNKETRERFSVYGLLVENDRILLVQPLHSEKWETPGGKIDEGEDEFFTLKRELLEEVGYACVEIGKCIRVQHGNFYADDLDQFFYSTQKFYLINKFKKSKKTLRDKNEINKAEWLPVNNELKKIIRENQIQVIEALFENIGKF